MQLAWQVDFLSILTKKSWNAVKLILTCHKGNSNFCFCFDGGKFILEGYTNFDIAENINTWKSSSGYLFTFMGRVVLWQSKLQKFVTLSTMKPNIWLLWKQVRSFEDKEIYKLIVIEARNLYFSLWQPRLLSTWVEMSHITERQNILMFDYIGFDMSWKNIYRMQLIKISTYKNPSDIMTKSY